MADAAASAFFIPEGWEARYPGSQLAFVTIPDNAPGVYGMTGAERTTQPELADFTWDGGG
jgi:hypothetical protein